MKIRSGFVSNSSSSSYIIAYDKNFFGDLKQFFTDNENEIGFETRVYDSSRIEEVFGDELNVDKEKLKETDSRGVLYMALDYDHTTIVDLLKFLNKANGGDKLEIIYGGDY